MTNPTKNPKSLRVVCDGTTNGTTVFDAKGNPIGMVQSIQINIDCNNQIPTMMMQIALPELDIVVPEEGVEVKLGTGIRVSSEEV